MGTAVNRRIRTIAFPPVRLLGLASRDLSERSGAARGGRRLLRLGARQFLYDGQAFLCGSIQFPDHLLLLDKLLFHPADRLFQKSRPALPIPVGGQGQIRVSGTERVQDALRDVWTNVTIIGFKRIVEQVKGKFVRREIVVPARDRISSFDKNSSSAARRIAFDA